MHENPALTPFTYLKNTKTMPRPLTEILQDIENFYPHEDEWLALDQLIEELWIARPTQEALPVLFRVFERFPDTDGAGVLWGILHGIESLPFTYETALEQSYARVPSEMAKIMRQRLVKHKNIAFR